MEDKVKKTMLFEKELHDKIMKLAEQNDRDFTNRLKRFEQISPTVQIKNAPLSLFLFILASPSVIVKYFINFLPVVNPD